jgi:hypothetical protein
MGVLIDLETRFSVYCCQLLCRIDHGNDGSRAAEVRAVGSRPSSRAIGRQCDLESALMKQAMVGWAEQQEVFDRGLSTLNPVRDVVGVEPPSVVASWELTAPVAGYQRTTNRRRYGASLAADGQWLAAVVDGDGNETAVARKAAERFRGDERGRAGDGPATALVRVLLARPQSSSREVEQELCPVSSGAMRLVSRQEGVGHPDQPVGAAWLG